MKKELVTRTTKEAEFCLGLVLNQFVFELNNEAGFVCFEENSQSS